MRNLWSKFKVKATGAALKVKAAMCNERGDGYVTQIITILVAVVLGALLLAGLYALFSTYILPTLNQRLQDIFNYSA